MGSKQAKDDPCKATRHDLPQEVWARMNEEIEECKKLAWEVQLLSERRILARLDMAKDQR